MSFKRSCAAEKQRSRDEDARALASGEKSREELQRENGHFAFANVRIRRGLRELVPERHAVIAERVARVHAGGVATLSVDEVEQSLRSDLDF